MNPTRGKKIVNGSLSALIEVGAGFHPDLTGRENIFLNGTILGMTRREIRTKLDDIIEFSGLSEFIDTPVKRYSSGMYARLGFAIACHVEPGHPRRRRGAERRRLGLPEPFDGEDAGDRRTAARR